MLVHTDVPEAPWFVVEADDKRHAGLNMIAQLLMTLPTARLTSHPPTTRRPSRASAGHMAAECISHTNTSASWDAVTRWPSLSAIRTASPFSSRPAPSSVTCPLAT